MATFMLTLRASKCRAALLIYKELIYKVLTDEVLIYDHNRTLFSK
jgi:hypothetical protein